MKILWLSHVIPYPPKAGTLLRAYHLLRETSRYHEVDLATFVQERWLTTFFESRDQGLQESEVALAEFCRSVSFLDIERLQRRGGRLRTAVECMFEREGYMAGWLRSAAAQRRLTELIALRNYDVVHFDVICLAPYFGLSGTIPATLGHQNIESHMMQRRAENETNRLKRLYFELEARKLRRVEQLAAPRFAMNYTCSELDSTRLLEFAPSARTTVIPNGVDCDFFQPQSHSLRPNSMIFVGTLSWYPNADAMLWFLREAWPLVRSTIPDATLDIVGPHCPDELRLLAGKAGGVTVHGFVDDMRPLVHSASLYVCPIRDGGGTKLKLLDAFALGKCVVAHPIACEGIDARDGHEVIMASDARQFAKQIQLCLMDTALRNRIGGAARELVENKYSFSSIGRQLAESFTMVGRGERIESAPSI